MALVCASIQGRHKMTLTDYCEKLYKTTDGTIVVHNGKGNYDYSELCAYASENPDEVEYLPTFEQTNEEKIYELQKYLESTDWYAIRFADEGTAIPDEVKTARSDARKNISELRDATTTATDTSTTTTTETT